MSIGVIRKLRPPQAPHIDPVDFVYTGGIQEYEIPFSGLYQLEVWGGGTVHGGYGGYSKGYYALKAGQKLYVVCGGQGPHGDGGAYNGGGHAHWRNMGTNSADSGGGATHIAKVTGTLASIGKTSFVDNENGLIVAGGGGGGANIWYAGWVSGGSGGGLTGGNYNSSITGGTQTSGYAFGQGGDGNQPDGGSTTNGGGGGGFYGGYGGRANGTGEWNGGAGGSGWIGGVPEITFKGTTYTPETTNGVNSGNGKARITFIG